MSAARTAFVGRSAELKRMEDWLDTSAVVTIVGTAGIGKSRLAMEFAARWDGEAYSLDLSQESTLEGCAASALRALGLPPNTPAQSVGRALAERSRPLLVLDDADPVVTPLATLVARWLRSAPQVRIVTTSRERLHISSERTLELGPLSSVGGQNSEAAELFKTRVEQVSPGVTLPDSTLAAWCEWLEGIPLAIELAAARAPFLGEVQGQRKLDLLKGGYRDAQVRHATLALAIEWSWGLLEDQEQRVLAQAAVFLGRFGLRTAQRVLTQPDSDLNALEALRLLAAKSFLRVHQDGTLQLFDAVREFAMDALTEEHQGALGRLEQYLVAESRETGDDQRLLANDVVAAADRVVAGTSTLDVNAGAWVVAFAGRLLESQGPASRLQELMQAGLKRLSTAHVDLTTLMRIHLAGGLRMQGKPEQAETVASKALIAKEQLTKDVHCQLLIEIAIARHGQRNLEGAVELYLLALKLSPSRREEGRVHANLGTIAHDRGDLDAAETAYQAALAALTVTDDLRVVGVVRSNLALLYQERGDQVMALETFGQALSDLEAAQEQYLGAIHRSNLGQLHLELNDPVAAVKHHDLALPHLRRIGDEHSISLCLCRRAAAKALATDLRGSQCDLDEASSIARDVDDPLLAVLVSLSRAYLPLGRALNAPSGAEQAKRVHDCRTAIVRAIEDAKINWRLSDDARLALRVLETQLGRLNAPSAQLPDGGLVVGIESRFFRNPDGRWGDLRRQTAARRILELLVERHEKAYATMEDFQAAAWPGERIQRDAATNRVHVALSKLRQSGLRELIVRDGEGYRLAKNLEIHRLPQTSPPDVASAPTK